MAEAFLEASDDVDSKLTDKSNVIPSHIFQRRRLKLVAIHLGASNSNDDAKQRDIARKICEQLMLHESAESVRNVKTCSSAKCVISSSDPDKTRDQVNSIHICAEDAAVRLIELMENDSSLNCGLGSNLNMDGQVECDASMMSAKTQLWTGIGAVSGCKNPILLVRSLYDHSTIVRPLGLVQPNFLVGSGARHWMREHCRHLLIPDSHLISSRSLSRYQRHKSNYDLAQNRRRTEVKSLANNVGDKMQLDTVGAIAVDCDDNIACAISSGGIMLKHKGRIGQASVPGAGCWAHDSTAVTTTGVGEYLTVSLFAKRFQDKLQARQLSSDQACPRDGETLVTRAIEDCYGDLLSSPALSHVPPSERLAGILTVNAFNSTKRHGVVPEESRDLSLSSSTLVDGRRELYLSYAHNTKSMCIGYMTSNDEQGQSVISRLDGDDGHGVCTVSAVPISIKTIKIVV